MGREGVEISTLASPPHPARYAKKRRLVDDRDQLHEEDENDKDDNVDEETRDYEQSVQEQSQWASTLEHAYVPSPHRHTTSFPLRPSFLFFLYVLYFATPLG